MSRKRMRGLKVRVGQGCCIRSGGPGKTVEAYKGGGVRGGSQI